MTWLDPLIAVGIGLWVLPRTWTLLKASTHILLEGTPAEVDLAKLRTRMESTAGVVGIHDLHVWTLTSGRYILTAHVVTNREASPGLLRTLSEELRTEFKIFHTTLQLEDEVCGDLHEPLHEPASPDVGPHAAPDHDAHKH